MLEGQSAKYKFYHGRPANGTLEEYFGDLFDNKDLNGNERWKREVPLLITFFVYRRVHHVNRHKMTYGHFLWSGDSHEGLPYISPQPSTDGDETTK